LGMSGSASRLVQKGGADTMRKDKGTMLSPQKGQGIFRKSRQTVKLHLNNKS